MALAAVFAVAPLLPRGPGYLGWPGGWVDLVVPALAVVWVAARVAARGRPPAPSPIPLWPWDLCAAVIVGSAAYGLMADNVVTSPAFVARLSDVGALFRPMHQLTNPLYPLRIALTMLEGWIALRLVIATCGWADDPRRRAGLALSGWAAGFGAVALFAVVQYVTRFQLDPYWVRANPSLVRAHATLDDPNALGACLVLGLGLLVGLLWMEQSTRRRVWWSLLLVIGAAGLATTMSRAALGAIALAPAAVLAIGPTPVAPWQRAARAGARVFLGTLAVAVLASILLRAFTTEARRSNPTGPVDMIVKTFDPRESTGWVLRGRLPWWRAATLMFADHPVTGVGVGRFQRLVRAYGGGKHAENAHNFFLQSLAESGVIGGLAFVVLCASIVAAFARLLREAEDDPWRRALALGGLIGIVAFLLTLLTGHTLRVTSGQMAFSGFVALAATMAAPARRVAPARAASVGRRVAGWVVLVAAILVPPIVGAAAHVGPFLGDWGYNSGLYGVEHTRAGLRYRWTGEHAVVELDVPDRASALVVETAAVRLVRGGSPVRVRVTVAGDSREVTVSEPGRRSVTLPLGGAPAPRRVRLVIDVEPTIVPAADGHSRDTRALGVQLFVPRFELQSAPRGR